VCVCVCVCVFVPWFPMVEFSNKCFLIPGLHEIKAVEMNKLETGPQGTAGRVTRSRGTPII
jgi:hypothetical protein